MLLRFDPFSDDFRWAVLGGTGAYEKLHGTGAGEGFPIPVGVLDVYSGQMHVD